MSNTRPPVLGFSVIYRNPGHWDICSDGGRAFRIRGEPGNVLVGDERTRVAAAAPWMIFQTVSTALLFCADQLMLPPVDLESMFDSVWADPSTPAVVCKPVAPDLPDNRWAWCHKRADETWEVFRARMDRETPAGLNSNVLTPEQSAWRDMAKG